MNNFYTDPGAQFNADNTSVRIDHKLSDKNYLFARVGSRFTIRMPIRALCCRATAARETTIPGASVIISDTYTISPAIVNEMKLGYSSQSFDYGALTMFRTSSA